MRARADQLCACLTPLHVLTARRIAEYGGARFARGLYITSVDNEKDRHYANAMREFCARVEYQVVPGEDGYRAPKHLSIWARRLRYRIAFRRYGPVRTVYVPSSNNHYVYILLSAIRFSELVTFDDGLLNVNPSSPLFRKRTRLRARAFLLAAGVTSWPERIRALATRHFSLYDLENVCPRVEKIRLIGDTDRLPALAGKLMPVRILIGPAPEVGAKVWTRLRDAARQLRFDAYLPHPRERGHMIDRIEYVQTPLVAEDYIVSRLKSEPTLAVQIYGYDSTALVNLARTPRIEVFSLLDDTAETSGLRSLMQQSGVVMLT